MSKSIVDQRAEVLADAQAKLADPSCTASDLASAKAQLDQVRQWDDIISASAAADQLMAPAKNGPGVQSISQDGPLSLGEHFVKHAHERLLAIKGLPGASVGAPEWIRGKAASDPQVVGGALPSGLGVPQFDTTVVEGFRRATVDDILGQGTVSGSSITYFVEGAAEGAVTPVSESSQKPQLHYAYTTVTDTLSKVAGFIKISDEMLEDVPFLVSEINGRLIYDLSIVREGQYLDGTGTPPAIKGLMRRSDVQTETGSSTADNVDSVFRAIMKVQTGSGLAADAIVLNPADYEAFRLLKDANGVYQAGGPWVGNYGQGVTPGVLEYPALWGLRTVVTTAIAAKKVLVGAFKQAATRYTKGGVRVDSTNSNEDDFENNRITIRAEQRIGLAVRKPTAFVIDTLS